jgi:hypothetical protein
MARERYLSFGTMYVPCDPIYTETGPFLDMKFAGYSCLLFVFEIFTISFSMTHHKEESGSAFTALGRG